MTLYQVRCIRFAWHKLGKGAKAICEQFGISEAERVAVVAAGDKLAPEEVVRRIGRVRSDMTAEEVWAVMGREEMAAATGSE